MPNKLQAYAEQAERTARQITGSHLAWTAFLTTAARLYKYPYNEQLMIYMQRPEATACAEYDFWNEKMGRYVRRGSTGIALIDATGYKPRLKYVFDVSDTGGKENARRVNLSLLISPDGSIIPLSKSTFFMSSSYNLWCQNGARSYKIILCGDTAR